MTRIKVFWDAFGPEKYRRVETAANEWLEYNKNKIEVLSITQVDSNYSFIITILYKLIVE